MKKLSVQPIHHGNNQLQAARAILMGVVLITSSLTAFAQKEKAGKTYRLSGTVYEQISGKKQSPLDFASVTLPDLSIGTTTRVDGSFSISNIKAGKVHLHISYVGKVDIDTLLQVNGDMQMKFVMTDENFRLKEVVVTGNANKAGQATSSRISRNALDHIQATSLSDVMALLPGGITTNPTLGYAKQMYLRGDASNANAFGVSVIADGAPISNNANLQTMNPTVAGSTSVLGGGASPNGGTDLRLISTDNIASVDVIRGIPSVKYGDLLSGAVIIHSKAGHTPLRIRSKVNPHVFEVSAERGFKLNKHWGMLNLSGNYAYNVKDPVQSYLTYRRANIKALHSLRVGNALTNNLTMDFYYGADRRKRNPDDEITKKESRGDQWGVRFNTNGTWQANQSWLNSLDYAASFSYTDKQSYDAEQQTAATAPYSMTTTDGAILSNRPGVDLFDKSGKKITNIPETEKDLYAMQLPSTYMGEYHIDGREVNFFAKLTGHLNKEWGRTRHHVIWGADFKADGNVGKGKTFSPTAPPYRNLSAVNSTFRPRPYSDIPFVRQFGLYAEENLRWDGGNRILQLTAGVRMDKVQNLRAVVAPRINASAEIIPGTFYLVGGYGITAKAPSVLFLYPEKAYFELVNYNDLSNDRIPEEKRLMMTTTRVFDAQNPDLKMATNEKAELGFDLKIKQAKLMVRAFQERLHDGYMMAPTLNTFKHIYYDVYKRIKTNPLELQGSYPIFAKYSTPTNHLQSVTRGVEFDLNLGRFDAIRTAFSMNGLWQRHQTYSSGYNFFDQHSSPAPSKNTHVGIYDKGMTKDNSESLVTTLRTTHNIPEIGFVITLTAQAIWAESQWYDFKNHTMPVKYLSIDDGKVYDFKPELVDENDENNPFNLLLRKTNEALYIKERYAPACTFNIHLTKELGETMRVSFFANNVVRHYTSVRSKRTPNSLLVRNQPIYFGLELSVKL